MDKVDFKNFLKQMEGAVKDLGGKAGDLAKALEKDASYGTKAGMLKVEQLTLENEKNKQLAQLGDLAYSLGKKGEIKHKKLDKMLKQIKDTDNKIRGKKVAISKLKKKRAGKKAGKANK